MALISCSECGNEVSDRAVSCPHCGAPNVKKLSSDQYTTSSSETVSKKGGIWIWVIGVPIGLLILILIIGAFASTSPEAKQRSEERSKIAACWDLQSKKSLDPSTARFTARLCEQMESDFRRKHNLKP